MVQFSANAANVYCNFCNLERLIKHQSVCAITLSNCVKLCAYFVYNEVLMIRQVDSQ